MPYRIRRSRCPIGFWGPDALLDSEIKMPYGIVRSQYLKSEQFHFGEVCRSWGEIGPPPRCTSHGAIKSTPDFCWMVNGLATGVMNGIRTDVTRQGQRPRRNAEDNLLKRGRGDGVWLRGSCGILCILCYLNNIVCRLVTASGNIIPIAKSI